MPITIAKELKKLSQQINIKYAAVTLTYLTTAIPENFYHPIFIE
ncbi:MAG: hypothetical protein ACKO9I_15890 [Sphaerospermopsis kisseleviana]|nr:hypothetical protein [Sphaerospermopsis sp. FACHB-1194]